LNPKNIALAIEAAKAKALESLIMPNLPAGEGGAIS